MSVIIPRTEILMQRKDVASHWVSVHQEPLSSGNLEGEHMQLAILVGLAVVIGAVAFALQNNVPVTVTFLLWRFDSSLPIVLLLAVAAGALIVALLSTPSVLRLQWTAARQRRRINALELANQELSARLEQPALAADPAPSGLERMAPR
jgi:uncharacterized integral membrane protein